MKKTLASLMIALSVFSLSAPAFAASDRVQWEWRDTITTAHPGFIDFLNDGNVLVVRNGYAEPAVLEVNEAKETVWQYGPIQANSAIRLTNGNTLITDSGAPGYPFKPRVIEVNAEQKVVWNFDFQSRADAPRYAERLTSGNTLITTAKKVLEVSPDKKEVWSYSKSLVNPVKAIRLGSGHTLIVDKGFTGGKVVEVDGSGKVVWQYGDDTAGTAKGKLSGPTDVVRRSDGTTAIVDFASARILELDAQKNVLKVISWQDVLKDLPIMNSWGVDLAADGHFYLSASYTNGKPTLLKLDDKSLKIYVDEKWLYTEVMPTTVNGSTLVPAREIFTAFGASISWDNKTKKLIASKGDIKAEMTLDSKEALLNGIPQTMEVSPRMTSGAVMVPLRFAAQAFGVTLKWDDTTKTLNLTTP